MAVLVNAQTRIRPAFGALCATLIASVLTTPLQAQTTADIQAFETAFITCLVTASPDFIAAALGDDWRRENDDANGLVRFHLNSNDQIVLTAAADSRFCQVEHAALSTDAARTLMMTVMQDGGVAFTEGAADELDCEAVTTAPGRIVSTRSAGPDPTCSDPNNSAIRVTYPAE